MREFGRTRKEGRRGEEDATNWELKAVTVRKEESFS